MGINEGTREVCDYGCETRWFGYGGDLEPTFIECHEKGIRVYEENGKHYEVPIAQIQKHEKLKTLIQKVTREAPYRTWRSAQGSEMDARFIKREGSKITLKDKQGKEIVLTAIQLAPGSRNIVRKYEEAREKQKTGSRGPLCYFSITLERDSVLESGFKSMSESWLSIWTTSS